ncbi:MAG: methyltransferase domain-containing protein [Myxococcota bacterium]
MDAPPAALPPNHHADHPQFTGLWGLGMGLVFLSSSRGAIGELACKEAGIRKGDRLVDIGCGPGAAVRRALRRGVDSALGIDPAPWMLRLGRLFTRDPRAVWAEGFAEQLPAGDGAATVAWSLSTVHHWHDLEVGLREVHRVLAPGGRFVVLEAQVEPGAVGIESHGWYEAQAQSFVAACEAAGFGGVELHARRAGKAEMWAVKAVR